MKKKKISLGTVIMILIMLIVGIFYAYNKYYFPNAKAYSNYIETYQEYDISEINEIDIDSINHKVIVKPSDDGKVKITYFQKNDNMNTYALDNGKLKMELIERVEDLDTLLFRTEKKIDTITIYIPTDNQIKINVNSSYGNLDMQNVSLNGISFQNTIGDVNLISVICPSVSIGLNTGNAAVVNSQINDLNVDIISGNIDLKIDEIIDEYDLFAKAIYGKLKLNDNDIIDEEKKVLSEIEYSENKDKKINIEILRGNINLQFKEEHD